MKKPKGFENIEGYLILYALLSLLLCLYLVSLHHRWMHIDDAWLGEQAYWLSQGEGIVRSDLFRGILDYDQRQFVFHKFFIMHGAAVVWLFGWSLYWLKSVSLFYYIVFMVVLYRYVRKNGPISFAQKDYLVCSVLLIANPLIFEYSYIFRPEIMVMTWGFLSFHLLMTGLKKGRLFHIVLSGMFTGLAVLAHLNGLIYIFAGLITLVKNRKYRDGGVFFTVAVVVSSFYLYDVLSPANFDRFLHQFLNGPALEKADFSLLTPMFEVLKEHKRFFHSPEEIFFSVLFILSIAFNRIQLIKLQQDLLLYVSTLIIALPIITHGGGTSKYMILYAPYIALIITSAMKNITTFSAIQRQIFLFCSIVYVGYSLYFSMKTISLNEDLAAYNTGLAAYLPRERTNILAPMSYIFNEIHTHRIQGLYCYKYLERHPHTPLTQQTFFDFAERYRNEFILIDEEFLSLLNITSPKENQVLSDYRIIKKLEHTIILKHVE